MSPKKSPDRDGRRGALGESSGRVPGCHGLSGQVDVIRQPD